VESQAYLVASREGGVGIIMPGCDGEDANLPILPTELLTGASTTNVP
jgi:hypothetical protein